MDEKAAQTRLITQAEAAARLSVSVRTLHKLRVAGEIAYIPGRPVRIPEGEIEAYIERMTIRAEAQRDEAAELARRAQKAAADAKMRNTLERLRRGISPESHRKLVEATIKRMVRDGR